MRDDQYQVQRQGYHMSLFDFIFPEQSQAMQLREIAYAGKELAAKSASRDAHESINNIKINGLNRRIQKLENDLALLTTVNILLIKKYVEDTGNSIDKVRDSIAEIDRIDGKEDGGLDTEELRKILGVKLAAATSDINEKCPDCGRRLLRSLDRCMYCGFTSNRPGV